LRSTGEPDPQPHGGRYPAGRVSQADRHEPERLGPRYRRPASAHQRDCTGKARGHGWADTDLRLSRYWGLSEGFWLHLQIDFDLMEQRRKMGAKLEKITPRAA